MNQPGPSDAVVPGAVEASTRPRSRTRSIFAAGLVALGLLVLAALHWIPSSTAHMNRSAEAPAVRSSGEPASVTLPEAALAKNPIATDRAVKVRMATDLLVVGSVAYDQDYYAVVGPLVGGR